MCIRDRLYVDAINRCIDYMEKYECDNIQISNFKCIIGWTYLIDLNNSELGKEALVESIQANDKCGRSYTGPGIRSEGSSVPCSSSAQSMPGPPPIMPICIICSMNELA